jgi:ribosomal protein L40E
MGNSALGDIKDTLFGWIFQDKKVNLEAKCPKCGAKVNTTMERCPGCGTHISSMFRLKCPRCEESNPLDATVCRKCGMEFARKEEEAPSSVSYACPMCGYRANYFMLQCPSCGVKFS